MLKKVRDSSLEDIEKIEEIRLVEETTDVSPDDVFYEIFRHARDFNYTERDVEDFISENGKGNNFDDKAKYILKKIQSLKYDCISQAAKHNMELKSYQRKAVEHMLKNRGMIAAFEVGTGKTLTAVTVANCMINLADYFYRDIDVLVITPVSLQENFKKEMRAYGSNPNSQRYIFYTPETFSRDYRDGYINCKRTLLIIDEAHNMRTDYRDIFSEFQVKKQKETTGRAENSISCASEAWKVLLLTGTPLYNAPSDIVNLAAMVKGEYPPTTENPYFLLEHNKEKFNEEYGNIFLFQESNKSDFPSRKDIIVGVLMDQKFLDQYNELESETATDKLKGRVTEKKSNAFYLAMRQAANALEPCLKCYEVIKIMREKYEKKEKMVFFSEFKESGIDLIKSDLAYYRIPYYEITGKTTDVKRAEYVRQYNRDNYYGILIITKAGGEGLDLRGVRHVILYEKGWNVAGMEQTIGRAIRYKSHDHLPPDQRNVTIWHMIILKPSDYLNGLPEEVIDYSDEIIYPGEEDAYLKVRDTKKMSADLYMFKNMIVKEQRLQTVREALKQIQIK